MSKLAQIAASLVVLMTAVDANSHPLMQASPETESIVREDGGISMRLHKTSNNDRTLSREEHTAMRKQRAAHQRIQQQRNYSWKNNISSWFGLAATTMGEEEMPTINIRDETYTVRITVDETPSPIQAIIDTTSAYTVIETTVCTDCATGKIDKASGNGGFSVTATAVSGNLSNPESTYSGFEGTATLCIAKDGVYSTVPTTSNIAAMPCIQNANVHFADVVATPNEDAVASLGMALGNGADSSGTTIDADKFFMNQFETAGKLDSSTKKFGLGILPDGGVGSNAGTTTSYMDIGTLSTAGHRTNFRETIQMDDDEFYWKTSMNGIRFGGLDSQAFGMESASIIVDTAKQCLQVPETQYDFIFDKLMNYSTGYYINAEDGYAYVDCSDRSGMQYIQLLMNDKWVQIRASEYLIDARTLYASEMRLTGACKLCVQMSPDANWHVGMTALVGYYTEFDYELKQMAMSPLFLDEKLALVAGTAPETIYGLNQTRTIILSSSIGLFIIASFVLLYFVSRDRPEPEGVVVGKANSTISLNELETLIENTIKKQNNVTQTNALE